MEGFLREGLGISKATEYVERMRTVSMGYKNADAARAEVFQTAPMFVRERTWDSGFKTHATACVQSDGALTLDGSLALDKVADFVKWLGEVYGD